MAQTAAYLVDHVIPHVPVRQWVLSLPIPLRPLLAAQLKLVTPALQPVHRAITRFLLDQAGLKTDEAGSDAVIQIQRFGLVANLNILLHCLVLAGVYRCDSEGEPVSVEVPAPTDEALQQRQSARHGSYSGQAAHERLHDGAGKRAGIVQVKLVPRWLTAWATLCTGLRSALKGLLTVAMTLGAISGQPANEVDKFGGTGGVHESGNSRR